MFPKKTLFERWKYCKNGKVPEKDDPVVINEKEVRQKIGYLTKNIPAFYPHLF